MQAAERLAGVLVDAIHKPRFAIAGDPQDRAFVEQRWGHMDRLPEPSGLVSPLK